MSLCYVTIQSQTYVISTCTFIHSHARLKSLLCNTISATFLAHTPLGWGSMYTYLCQAHLTRALTRTRMGGGVSIRVHLILWGVCPTVYDGFYVE